VAAFDWSRPQHIPELLDAEDVTMTTSALNVSVADLERFLLQASFRPPAPQPAPAAR
jgi:hypothetical protein